MPKEQYEISWKEYYRLLEVQSTANDQEIRRAYRAKTRAIHPDRLPRALPAERQLAEEKMKEVNEAYGVLNNPEKRRHYDSEWHRRHRPPQPAVDPARINFSDVLPGQKQTASLVIRNLGGHYKGFQFHGPELDRPDSWVKVTSYASLTDDNELPMQVEIEVEGWEWGKSYEETITVSLDDVQTQVRVELQTKAAPEVQPASRASPTTTASGYRRTYTPPIARPRRVPVWAKGLAALGALVVLGLVGWGALSVGGSKGGTLGDLKWTFTVTGAKLATPVDLDSDGSMDEVAVIATGDGGGLYAFHKNGSIKWSDPITNTKPFRALHLAPVDYDLDGRFSEILFVIDGDYHQGKWTAFLIFSANGTELWRYSCVDSFSTALNLGSPFTPQCSKKESESQYGDILKKHGFKLDSKFLDERNSRIDLDGDGTWDDAIRLHRNRLEVYHRISTPPSSQQRANAPSIVSPGTVVSEVGIETSTTGLKGYKEASLLEWAGTARLSDGRGPAHSPKGSTVATVNGTAVHVTNAEGSESRKLADSATPIEWLAWSPDGERLAFLSHHNLSVVKADGGKRLDIGCGGITQRASWSPDSRSVAFSARVCLLNNEFVGDRQSTNIYVLNVETAAATKITAYSSPTWADNPAWSPDGKRLAASIGGNVGILSLDGRELTRFRFNHKGDALGYAIWTPDGKWLVLTGRFSPYWNVSSPDGQKKLEPER